MWNCPNLRFRARSPWFTITIILWLLLHCFCLVSLFACVCVSAFAFYGNRRFVYCQYLSHPLSPSPSLRPFPSQNVYIRLSVNCSCSCCCCCFCCCCVQCSFLAHKIDMLAAPFFSRSSTHTQIDAALLSRSHIHAHRFEFEQQAFTDTQHTEA